MPHNFWIATKEIDEISSSQRAIEFINLPDSPIVSLSCLSFMCFTVLFFLEQNFLSSRASAIFRASRWRRWSAIIKIQLVDSSKKYLGETVFATFCYSSYCCCFKDFVYALRSVKFSRRRQNYISTTRI